MTRPAPLAERMIDAHGGPLAPGGGFAVRFSSGGLAFTSKLQGRALREVEAHIRPHAEEVELMPFPTPGRRAVFRRGVVQLEDGDGTVVSRRADARARFRDVRHLFWWDAIDMAYFAGYALWTYFSIPFLLDLPGFSTHELAPGEEDGRPLRRLAVRFPDDVHTHCRDQVLYVDEEGLVRRHDYVAEPFGQWARAAHLCLDYQTFGRVRLATRRRVYPRHRDGRTRAAPLLVWIDVHDVEVLTVARAPEMERG